MKTRRWFRARPIMLVAGALMVAGIAGCGGSSDESSSATGGSTTASGGPGGFQLTDEQRSCVEDKGVTLPQDGGQPPSGGSPPQGPPNAGAPGGQDFQKLQQALKDCGVDVPSPPQGGGNFDPSAMRKQITAYVTCVRKNGYDLPAPNTNGNGPVFDSSQVNQNDPKFKAASAKCQDLLPAGPQGSPTAGQ